MNILKIVSTHLCGKSSVANCAFEWSLLGVTAVMDFESRITSECLVADVAGGVSTHCLKHILTLLSRNHTHTFHEDGTHDNSFIIRFDYDYFCTCIKCQSTIFTLH